MTTNWRAWGLGLVLLLCLAGTVAAEDESVEPVLPFPAPELAAQPEDGAPSGDDEPPAGAPAADGAEEPSLPARRDFPAPPPGAGWERAGWNRSAAPRLQRSQAAVTCARFDHCWELAVEGTFTLFDEMTGVLGEAVVGPALSWDPNTYDGAFGGRVTLRRAIDGRSRVELRGVWYGEVDSTSTQNGALGFAPPAGGQTPASSGTLTTSSKLWSAEGTVWHALAQAGAWRWSGGIGVRYLHLEEEASLTNFNIGGPGAASVRSEVETSFIAGQIAGAATFFATPQTEVGLMLKALLGSMERDADVNDVSIFAGGPHSASNRKREFGFGGEVEVSVLQRITPYISATAGYALLFLNDVVRADDAMDFTQAASGAVQARQKTSAYLNHTFFVGFQINI